MADDNQESTISGIAADGPNGALEAQLAAENAEYKERMLRALAELDNYRRRAERERAEYLRFAPMEILRDLIPVLDDFERALKVETPDAEYAKGVELIYHRLLETLKKAGLEPIAATGKSFDPNHQQAVDRVHTDEFEDQTVLEEYQSGYNFKGRLLRPAMVKVAVNP